MADSEHGKYIITKPRKDLEIPDWAGSLSETRSTRMFYLDSDVIPGAFYVEVVWFWPTDEKDDSSPDPHTHEYDEVIGFFGTDPKDLNDLGAEIEFYIDGERNLMRESFLAFIPAGIEHCPLNILKITKPVFHFATIPSKNYG
jgi:hypothetical protein